jgi:hypothetical protein
MGEIEFVVQDGSEKQGGCFRAEDEGSERCGLESGGSSTADFGRCEVPFGANEEIQSRKFTRFSGCGQKGREWFCFGLERADDSTRCRSRIRCGKESIERSGFVNLGKPVLP